METVIVLKNLEYASDGNAGTVDKLSSTSEELAEGAVGVYNEKGDLLTDDIADYEDCKEVTIAYNKGGVVFQTNGITREKIMRLVKGDYVAPVLHTVVVGGPTSADGISFEAGSKGHVGIKVADNTFSGMFATDFFNASVYKKASMDEEDVVDALVAKLNANTSLPVTATKIDSFGNLFITIQSKKRGQVLTLSTEGLLEDALRTVDGSGSSVLPVNGSGHWEDVKQHEFEASMYRGNSNSRELTQEFYSSPMGVVKDETYKTIVMQERLRSPYLQETNVRPEYTFYIPSGEDNDLEDDLFDVLTKVAANFLIEEEEGG